MKVNKKLTLKQDESFEFIKFDGIQIKATSLPEEDLCHIAKASADKLKSFLPKGFDFDSNYDIVGVAFNAYTPNLGNKNGHIISGEKGISIAKNFIGKYINIEHQRKNVVGYISGYSFSSFPDDEPITEDQAVQLSIEGKVFNVSLSGIIWRAVNPDFVDLVVESGDKSSNKLGMISASWEVGFKQFNLLKGSKYYSECEVIEDEAKCKDLKGKLKMYGGSGLDEDGSPLYLNIIGEHILSLGIGFTENPAAEVKGVTTSENEVETEDEDEDEEDESEDVENEDEDDESESAKGCEEKKSEKINSLNVISEESLLKNMKITSITDINDENMNQIAASAITDFFAEELAKKSEEWSNKLNEKETENANILAKLAELTEQIENIKAEKEASEVKLNELEGQVLAKEKEDSFQLRMASVDSDYELSDEDRKIVVAEIKECNTDEEFNAWFEKFSVLAKEKSKASIAARQEEINNLKNSIVANASENAVNNNNVSEPNVDKANDVVVDSINNATVVNDISNASNGAQSLAERMKSAFGGDNIKITIKK
jgi:hypothetical protein